MTTTVDARTARTALACLTEPGSEAVYRLVRAHGPVKALSRVLAGEAAGDAERALVESARTRLGDGALDRIVDDAVARTRRIGARIVTPEDDEWPAQLADLALIAQPGGDRIARDT